jgi:hypothetical protein
MSGTDMSDYLPRRDPLDVVVAAAAELGMMVQSRSAIQVRLEHPRHGDRILIHVTKHAGGLQASSMITTLPTDVADMLIGYLKHFVASNPDLRLYVPPQGAPSTVTLLLRLNTIDAGMLKQHLLLLSDEVSALRRKSAEGTASTCVEWANTHKLQR